jgi:hypothetical protein
MTDYAESHPEMPPGTWPIVDLSEGKPLAPVYIVPGLVVRPGDTLVIGLPENISAELADDYVRTARAQKALADIDIVFVAGVIQLAKIERGRDEDQAQGQATPDHDPDRPDSDPPVSTWDRLQQSRPNGGNHPDPALPAWRTLIEHRPKETLSQDGSIVPGMRATHGSEAAASDAFQRAGWAAFVICGLALFAWFVTWLVRVIWS